MAADTSAYDLLRGTQRRARQTPASTSFNDAVGVAAQIGKLQAPQEELLAADDKEGVVGGIALQAPLRPGASAADERVGLWWAIRGSQVFYFPLAGPQGTPLAVHTLPKEVVVTSARCIVVLIGSFPLAPAVAENSGSAGLAPPSPGARDVACSAIICADFSVVVFTNGEIHHARHRLPRQASAPLGQAPAFAVSAAPSPGNSGVVLVVGTTAGRLLTLLLYKVGGRFEIEVGALWPTARSESSLRSFLKRVRHSLGAGQGQAAPVAGPGYHAEAQVVPTVLAKAVELTPPPAGTGALFAALALGEEELAFYVHPQNLTTPELMWVAKVSDLLGPELVTRPRLLAATRCCEQPEGLILLYASDNDAVIAQNQRDDLHANSVGGTTSGATCLARLEWPAPWCEPPRVLQHHALVAQAPEALRVPTTSAAAGGELSFVKVAGSLSVVAARLWDGKFLLSMVCLTADGLDIAEVRFVDMNIMGLAFVSEGASFARISLVTPHGLLECSPLKAPCERSVGVPSDEDEDMGALGVRAQGLLREAYEFYLVGQEDRTAGSIEHAFAQGANSVLAAVESSARELMDAPRASGSQWSDVDDAVATRHMLFDRARDLHHWLGFLSECGIWTRLGALPGVIVARKAACEACERVAAASRLRELNDFQPEVFEASIRRALQDIPDNDHSASVEATATDSNGPENRALNARKYYGRVSACECLLSNLVDYPRSLPLGSSDVIDAVLFTNAVFSAFLEAALERRAHVISAFPELLPPPDFSAAARCLPNSSPPPRAIGSDWLMSHRMLCALEDLRLLNLDVIPSAPVGRGLLMLDAQAMRVIESLRDLCRSTLRAAHASLGDLQATLMTKLRRSVLQHLAQAEFVFGSPPQRALLLAEEFEDIEAVVTLAARADPTRLDEHLANSPCFRAQAFAHFLRVAALRPLFFHAIQRFDLKRAEVEAFLTPYPELRWTLEVHTLGDHSSSEDWHRAMEKISRCVAATVQQEKDSTAKRDAFAAFAAVVQRAGGSEIVALDLACLGRLEALCLRFDSGGGVGGAVAAAASGCKRPAPPDQPPAAAEDILCRLADCMGSAMPLVRGEGAEGQLFSDAARLVSMVERRLEERGVDIEASLQPHSHGTADVIEGTPAGVISTLQLLWEKVVSAEKTSWQQVLGAHEGSERDTLLASLGFCRMMRWREGGSTPIRRPLSARLEPLCERFAVLRPLAPALRLVHDDSLFVAGSAVAGDCPSCSAAATSTGGRWHASPAAMAAVR